MLTVVLDCLGKKRKEKAIWHMFPTYAIFSNLFGVWLAAPTDM